MVRHQIPVSCSCLLTLLLLAAGSDGYVRFCYFTNWSQFRTNASFTPLDIDPALCTHILYAFGELNGTTILPIEYNDFQMYSQMMSLKNANPSLKVLLAIGGWDANNTHFTNLAASSTMTAAFAQTAITYLREHKFDGLDIDWEYPAGRGGPPSDRVAFTVLLQSLRAAFEEEAEQTQLPQLLLTAAVVAGIQQANNYYQLDQIGRSLDYVNIMAYDLHGSWESVTGIHCALYPDVDDCVTGWLNAGVPRDKIVLGVAAYGRTFRLSSSNPEPQNFGLRQPASGPGLQGPSTLANGSLAYFEICEKIKQENWTEVYDASHDSPIAYGRVGTNIDWVGYDNVQSIREKAQYIRARGLAGSLMWSLDMDDFKNRCGENRFPLASALLEQLPSDGEMTSAVPTTPEVTTAEVTSPEITTEETTTTTTETTAAMETTTEQLTTSTTSTTSTTTTTMATETPTITTVGITTTEQEDVTTEASETTTAEQEDVTTEAAETTTAEQEDVTTEHAEAAETTTTEKSTTEDIVDIEDMGSDSDDSTPADPGWVTTTPSPTTTFTSTSTTVATTSTTTRRPLFKLPRLPSFRPVKPYRCGLRLSDARPHSMVQGNPRMFVALNKGFISIVCVCPEPFVYNPCIKRCDFKTNRGACNKWF